MKLYASEQDADDQTEGEEPEVEEEAEGGEEAEGAEEEAEGEEPEGGEETPAQRAIAQRAETERLARERGELDGRRQAEQRAEQQRAKDAEDRREQEALSTMTEEQRTQYFLAKEVRNTKNENTATRLLVASSTDQHKFSRTLAKKPQYSKFEDEVERRHQATLSAGGFISRDVILAHLIGEKALETNNVKEQKQAGARRVASQRQGGARQVRGDTTGRGGKTKSVVQRAEENDWAI